MRKLTLILSVVMLAGPALADDVLPPNWRGEEGSTFQEWKFDTPQQDQIEPGNDVSQWLPGTVVEHVEPDDQNPFYLESAYGREGVWPLSGWMRFHIINFPPQNEYKIVRVQVTWHIGDDTYPDEPELLFFDPIPVEPIQDIQTPIYKKTWCQDDWYTSVYEWTIMPNPTEEWFTIDGDILVDQVVVDTICVPEPATMGLMATGGLFALLRRRRK